MAADSTELARQLGEVQGRLAALQREMTAHRRESRDSTALLHRRISDGNAEVMAKIRENAAAIHALEAARVGAAAVGKFKRTLGYVLLALSGGAGAEVLRALKVWFSSNG